MAMLGGVNVADPAKMPTLAELKSARGVIEDLVATGISADDLLSMAQESNKGAERFWLYSNAFALQCKAGEFDIATETIRTFRKNVIGVPDVDIIALIERNAKKGLVDAPELAEILEDAKSRQIALKLMKQVSAKLRKSPRDEDLKIMLAEAQAVSGDWKSALKLFAETKGSVSAVAKGEIAGMLTVKKATFWWEYVPCRELVGSKVFKAHAAEIYSELLKADKLSAVEKMLAEKRIEQLSVKKPDVDENSPGTSETASEEDDGHEVEEVVFTTEEKDPTEWKYTFDMPVKGWNTDKFDDHNWKIGKAMFSNERGKTYWRGGDIWLRKKFKLKDSKQISSIVIKLFVDDTCEIWLNGEFVHAEGYTNGRYSQRELTEDDCALFKNGENLIAVRAKDFGGGAWFDMGMTIRRKVSNGRNGSSAVKPERNGMGNEMGPKPVAAKIPDGLIHRWSFSGDLTDSIGGRDARAEGGEISFKKGEVVITPQSGYVNLGENVIIPSKDGELTIEIWATQYSINNWSRVFAIPDNWGDNDFYWSWNWGTQPNKWQWKVAGFGCWNKTIGDGLRPGVEHYFSVKYYKNAEGCPAFTVFVFRGGNYYWGRNEPLSGQLFASHRAFWLGKSACGNDSQADASYNEVRIWNRALADEEIKLSAKTGPDKVPNFKVCPPSKQSTPASEDKLLEAEFAHDREMMKRKLGKTPNSALSGSPIARSEDGRRVVSISDVRQMNTDDRLPADVEQRFNASLKIKSFCGQDFGTSSDKYRYIGEHSGTGGRLSQPFRMFTDYTIWGSRKYHRVAKVDLRGKVSDLEEADVKAEVDAVARILENKYKVRLTEDPRPRWRAPSSNGFNYSKSYDDDEKTIKVSCRKWDADVNLELSFKNKQVDAQNDAWQKTQPKKQLRMSANQGADIL